MNEIKDVMKVLKRLSNDELREVQDFAEFLLSKRGAKSGWTAHRKETGKSDSGGNWEIDYEDYDDFIR